MLELFAKRSYVEAGFEKKKMIQKFEEILDLDVMWRRGKKQISKTKLLKEEHLPMSKESLVSNILQQALKWHHMICPSPGLQYKRFWGPF